MSEAPTHPPPSDEAAAWEVMPDTLVLRPSLLAALDVTAKILGAVAAVVLPVALPALIAGKGLTAGVFLFGAQALSLYPALIAAFAPAMQLAFTRYRIDADGVTTRTQILSKSEKRVTWEKVTALRHRKTFVDALLGIERLDIVAYGQRGTTLHLVGLRGAAPIRDRIALEMRRSASVAALFRGD